MRQRAAVKVHYFNHGGGSAGALKAHTRYLARDDLSEGAQAPALQPAIGAPEDSARAHADYLARGERGRDVFYGPDGEGIDGGARAEAWARSDKRHFRIILAPEEGERLRDLTGYTRQVMRRPQPSSAHASPGSRSTTTIPAMPIPTSSCAGAGPMGRT